MTQALRPLSRPRSACLGAVLLVLAFGGSPAALQGQIEDCEFLPGTRNWTSRTSGNSSITYVSRPRIRCNDGRYIEADSAVSFSATGYTELRGNVYFQDASQSLRAVDARYYDQMRRLEADGDVVLTDRESGNVMTGDRLIYLRVMPGRPMEELNMLGGRPTTTLYPGSGDASAPDAEPQTPYEVEADRIYLLGESLFRAFGNVEVVRDSLDARADTMHYDRDAGVIDFGGNARLQQGEMDLRGRGIQVVLPGEVIQEIVATEEATLVGEDLDLDAYLIHLYFTDEALDRLVAVGERRALGLDEGEGDEDEGQAPPARAGVAPDRAGDPDVAADSLEAVDPAEGRAVATSEGLVMTADSLEVLAPGETLERVIAVGGARAVSTARDSLNTPDTPEIVRSDWIEGDTVVAFLRPEEGDPAIEGEPARPEPSDVRVPVIEADADPAPDTDRSYVLERLIATVNARSLYRMDPEEEQPPKETLTADSALVVEPAAADTLAVDSLAIVGDSLVVPAGATPVRRLAVHYVEADRILISFLDGLVDLMEVTGLRRGLYMEPARESRAATATQGRLP